MTPGQVQMEGTNDIAATLDSTLLLACPVCQSDLAETLGVAGGGGDGEPGAAVVMCCGECGTVYLTPPGPAAPDDAPPEFRNPSGDGARYELIVLDLSLERALEPAELLREVARSLSTGGRIVVIADNAKSSCFAAFGGRHWWGYARPGVRQQFAAEGLAHLAAASGLQTRSIATRFSAKAWLESMKRWLRDWGAGAGLTAALTGRWLVPLAIAGAVESLAVLRGRGAVLVVEMVRT